MTMRYLVICFLLACASSKPCPVALQPQPQAKKFAMRDYMFVLLKRGPAWTPEQTPETKKIFEGHMANIEAMAKAGKLVLAGPLDAPDTDRDAYAGIFIFDTKTVEETKTLLSHDPAIAVGRLVPEFRTWYGPVGLTYDGAER